ncbi:MAG: very short patch repair endonuclease [Dongiaceae bacterium]
MSNNRRHLAQTNGRSILLHGQGPAGAMMVDRVTPEARSAMMAAVGGKNTKPERLVRSRLFASGYRFRLYRRDLPGSPDIVLPRHRMAVFVHGCFWHGHDCSRGRPPKSNVEFWKAKIKRNRARDIAIVAAIESLGWRVGIVWECRVEKDTDAIIRCLQESVETPS